MEAKKRVSVARKNLTSFRTKLMREVKKESNVKYAVTRAGIIHCSLVVSSYEKFVI